MSKEKKPIETPNHDPVFSDAAFTHNNLLTLPDVLKKHLTDKGLDWRFLNAREFRAAGGYHKSHWKPFVADDEIRGKLGIGALSAEGHLQRGDLILGIRTKALTAKHKEYLTEKNRRYSNFAKTEANKMREEIRRRGLGDSVQVEEGYDEDEKGFN